MRGALLPPVFCFHTGGICWLKTLFHTVVFFRMGPRVSSYREVPQRMKSLGARFLPIPQALSARARRPSPRPTGTRRLSHTSSRSVDLPREPQMGPKFLPPKRFFLHAFQAVNVLLLNPLQKSYWVLMNTNMRICLTSVLRTSLQKKLKAQILYLQLMVTGPKMRVYSVL